MKWSLGFKEVVVIRKREIGTVVDKDTSCRYAETLSLDFRISKTTIGGIGIVSFSLRRVSCALVFVMGIMRG